MKAAAKINEFGSWLALTAILIVVSSGANAAQVCTTQVAGKQEFYGISGSSDNHVIAVGKKGSIFLNNGSAWTDMTGPTKSNLNDVEVVNSTTAFAVGDKGTVLQLTGGVWVDQSGATNENLLGVWAASATEAYAVGRKGTILFYNGSTWTDQSAAAGTSNRTLEDAWGDANSFYTVNERGELYRYDRNTGTWDPPNSSCSTGAGFEDLWGDSSGNIYLAHRDGVYLYDGASCTLVTTASQNLTGIYGSTTGGQVYATGRNGVVVTFDGVSWVESLQGTSHIFDDWVSSAGTAYFAGKGGAITTCEEVVPVFVVNHDRFGIHCLPETITVGVEDSSANPMFNYNEQVTLDTQSGTGNWLLVGGSGALVDGSLNDGVATYDWPLGESSAVFALDYPDGPATINVDVYQSNNTAFRDNDGEGDIVFSANGFTLTALPLSNPPPGLIVPFNATQVAGTDFAVSLAAYGQTPSDPVCGIIENYTGPQNLKFWFNRVDPVAGTIATTIDGTASAVTEAAAGNQAVTFANGQAVVTGKYKDVGSLQLFVKDDSLAHPDLPLGIRGATSSFVVKPAYFSLSNIEDSGGTGNPAAADSSGAIFIAAADDFSVTVGAYDAEGDLTPNYGQESTPETVQLTSVLVAPAAGIDPGLNPGPGFGPFAGGVATGTTFSWPEVGIITLQPSVGDGNYLSGGDVTGSTSGNVGRFIPDHFTTSLNTPLFQTQCGSGGFTYVGQSFDYLVNPVLTVTARASNSDVTQNYTGSWFKITNLTLQNRNYTAASGTLDVFGLPPSSSDPVIADTAAGTGTLLFDSGTGLSFVRTAAEAPFDADITLSIEIFDSDGVTTLATPVTVASIPFDNGPSVRFGRVRLLDTIGSELVNLNVPMRTEYFFNAATGFVTNSDDSCTTNVSLSLDNFTTNLALGETCVLDSGSPGDSGAGCAVAGPAGQRFREPPLAGDFNLFLLAPGAGNDGSTSISADVPTWLEFDWDALAPGLEDPSGTARFGIYDGDGKRIYMRELY